MRYGRKLVQFLDLIVYDPFDQIIDDRLIKYDHIYLIFSFVWLLNTARKSPWMHKMKTNLQIHTWCRISFGTWIIKKAEFKILLRFQVSFDYEYSNLSLGTWKIRISELIFCVIGDIKFQDSNWKFSTFLERLSTSSHH